MYFILLVLVLAVITHAAGFATDMLAAGDVGEGLANSLSGTGRTGGTSGSFSFGSLGKASV